ncbi:MAG: hypothetical protein ACJ0GQ_00765 [Parasynechococcus sp.]
MSAAVHNGHNMIPAWIHDPVRAQGGHRFGASVHEGLELRFEAHFLDPLTFGVLAFNAIHGWSITLTSKVTFTISTRNQQRGFGIMLKSPHIGRFLTS